MYAAIALILLAGQPATTTTVGASCTAWTMPHSQQSFWRDNSTQSDCASLTADKPGILPQEVTHWTATVAGDVKDFGKDRAAAALWITNHAR